MKAKLPAYSIFLPTSKRVARGETSVFTLYASTDAFLNFKGLQEASSRVMLATNDAHRPAGAVFLPPQGCWPLHHPLPSAYRNSSLQLHRRVWLLSDSCRNIVIFQTMLMVIAMLTGEEAEKRRRVFPMNARSFGKCSVHRVGKNFRICHAVCCVLHSCWDFFRIFRHTQHRKRLGHYDDSFPACHKFLLRLPYPAGLPTPKPRC